MSLDPLVCPCSTMFRIDAPHLAWVLENLVEGRVVNQITVDAETSDAAQGRARTDARHHVTQAPKAGYRADEYGREGCRSKEAPSCNETVRPDARIFVAGHRGLVGSAIVRRLERAGFTNVLTASREQLDLRDQAAVNYWFRANRPEYVFLVAGTVGGILANSTRPAEFIYDNMMIHATVVQASHVYGVDEAALPRQLVHLPARRARSRSTEDALLTGPLEPTNEPYAIAKIAGIKLCQAYRAQYGCNFISAMPTNLYGPNDNFDLTSSATCCRR